jgi:hypothetical protein
MTTKTETQQPATAPPTEHAAFRLTDQDVELLRAALSAKLTEREADVLVWYQELPRVWEEGHEGHCALVHDGKIVSLWDTHNDAIQAGYDKFGFDRPFFRPTLRAVNSTVSGHS